MLIFSSPILSQFENAEALYIAWTAKVHMKYLRACRMSHTLKHEGQLAACAGAGIVLQCFVELEDR